MWDVHVIHAYNTEHREKISFYGAIARNDFTWSKRIQVSERLQTLPKRTLTSLNYKNTINNAKIYLPSWMILDKTLIQENKKHFARQWFLEKEQNYAKNKSAKLEEKSNLCCQIRLMGLSHKVFYGTRDFTLKKSRDSKNIKYPRLFFIFALFGFWSFCHGARNKNKISSMIFALIHKMISFIYFQSNFHLFLMMFRLNPEYLALGSILGWVKFFAH